MANKAIKVHYFYPISKLESGEEKLFNLSPILNGLNNVEVEERILEDGEGNIQLKKIDFYPENKRWELSFLRNRTEAPFITKLDDKVDTAEALEDDEFVGQECCMLYDEESKIIALQNNRSSVSFSGISHFLQNYSKQGVSLYPIVYKDEYCEISDEPEIEYKSVIIGYTDITKIRELATIKDNDAIQLLAKLTNDISAVNGKIELSVGRSTNFLGKFKLKQLVNFFKKNQGITRSLKVKMLDNDTIRLIDLLSNKANDKIQISVTKDDPKTFNKILNSMNAVFDVALNETFEKCKKII
ncbi:DUF6731 family protein [Clostridium botulinum]